MQTRAVGCAFFYAFTHRWRAFVFARAHASGLRTQAADRESAQVVALLKVTLSCRLSFSLIFYFICGMNA